MSKRNVLILKPGYSEVLYHESQSRQGSLGDVLRTTPILHLFENDRVTWATDPTAFPILEGNPLIDRLIKLDWITSLQLQAEHFDMLINLEGIPGICVLAEKIGANRKYGFSPDRVDGRIQVAPYLGSESIMQGVDRAVNKKPVQQLVIEMLGHPWTGQEYVLGYTPTTSEKVDFALNPVSGSKWPTKSWPIGHWNKLEELLTADGYTVARQDKGNPPIAEAGLHPYIDWLNSARAIVSVDTLGLHLGIALRKPILGLFGPTSVDEVHFYGRGKGISIEPQIPCMPCYAPKCSYHEEKYCMNQISPEQVFAEAKVLLAQ